MPTLGIIGTGNIGSAIAHLAVNAGIPVVLSNSRGPETLAGLVSELGPLASAGTIEQSAAAGDVVVLSVPLTAHTAIPASLLEGKAVLDTTNYYPFRDGRVAELDEERLTTSELVLQHFQGAGLTKAFNNILAHHIPQLARPAGAPDRTAVPVAGDDATAKAKVVGLIEQLGFDTVDAGTLAESWRFEPEAAAYTRLYLADPATPDDTMLEAPAAPVSAERLSDALKRAEPVRVAARTF
ncbi:NADPH-dependent F420 reductase [Arthrobacter ramosus]|uniref:NADPH-dependent F420 reductase n=1 Tax=Arthrobacter ramosus TaxID=1672 RepID=A0ABV5Y1N7_ARTRM|nr:NADPH-dependent F420 reductase [Arthrobacter ramosus]